MKPRTPVTMLPALKKYSPEPNLNDNSTLPLNSTLFIIVKVNPLAIAHSPKIISTIDIALSIGLYATAPNLIT